eukprot:735646_1
MGKRIQSLSETGAPSLLGETHPLMTFSFGIHAKIVVLYASSFMDNFLLSFCLQKMWILMHKHKGKRHKGALIPTNHARSDARITKFCYYGPSGSIQNIKLICWFGSYLDLELW